MRLNKIQKTAVTALEDIKARDIVVLDVRKLTSLYDTLIIATAESARQVKALSQHVRESSVTPAASRAAWPDGSSAVKIWTGESFPTAACAHASWQEPYSMGFEGPH